MEFFNKKQDVIDIELTSYGKQLLSRGLFKPVYYAFSDDGVLYDQKWMTGSSITEEQSQVEPRIQEETPRLKVQARKVGAERAIFNSGEKFIYDHTLGLTLDPNFTQTIQDLFEFSSLQELDDYFIKLNLNAKFAESEKLLENFLGTKSYFNDYNPAWNLLLYHGDIKNSTSFYEKNDITTDVPQVNITLKDTVYKMSPLETEKLPAWAAHMAKALKWDDPKKKIPAAKNIMSLFNSVGEDTDAIDDLYFETFDLDDGRVFIIKDFVFLSLEEQNVDFTKENFMIEVFEVTTTSNEDKGEEELVKMIFDSAAQGDPLKISDVFEIEVDDEIDLQIACALINKDKALKDQNIYTSNVFDCTEIPSGPGVNIDPYTNLPEVDVGETC